MGEGSRVERFFCCGVDHNSKHCVYLITDGLVADRLVNDDATTEAALLGRIEGALKGGVRLVQLREKSLGAPALLKLATSVRALTSRYRAGLILNCSTEADLEVALLAHADGVHLPRSGPNIKTARSYLDNTLGTRA
ncbi:MAG: thiamine phosphate synthase, partial [Proteobacteria bacterium]|nr:thiamine phosphate synthase [Pseudomonadota bacterium]